MRVTVAVLGMALAANAARAQTILFVDDDAPFGGDGSSWNTSYRFLQDALDEANQDGSPVGEIRLGGGAYKPDIDEAGIVTPGDRGATFDLPPGTDLRGGFRGLAPGADPDDQDPALFESILTGDIGALDDITDNSWTILTVADVRRPDMFKHSLVEGLVIEHGNNDVRLSDNGSAIMNSNVAMTLRNCRIRDNLCTDFSAGIVVIEKEHALEPFYDVVFDSVVFERNGGDRVCLYKVDPMNVFRLTNCLFVDNSIATMLLLSGDAETIIESCDFLRNIGPARLFLTSNTLDIRDCTFDGGGGGLFLTLGPTAEGKTPDTTIQRCRFENLVGNASGVGLKISGPDNCNQPMYVLDCSFIGNRSEVTQFTNTGGAAVYVAGLDALVVFERCEFIDNHSTIRPSFAFLDGGGAIRSDGRMTLIDCYFEGNSSSINGGAIFCASGRTDLISCTFVDNRCGTPGFPIAKGSAVTALETDILAINCRFIGNTGTGAAVDLHKPNSAAFVGCTFSQNSATLGPAAVGISSIAVGPFEVAVFASCVFWNNHSDDPGLPSDEVAIDPTRVVYTDSIIHNWPGDPSGTRISTSDPMFVDPIGPDGVPGTGDEDYSLRPGSPAIEMGSNDLLPLDWYDLDADGDRSERIPFDARGNERQADSDASGLFTMDAGAFEFAGAVPSCPIDLTVAGAGPGDQHYGTPDGLLTVTDLFYFVGLWLDADRRANLTTQGVPIGDPLHGYADCDVTAIDLQYYINLWINGCP